MSKEKDDKVQLPSPRLEGKLSVEEALARRRSVRDYAKEELTLAEVSQLLWAAQGLTKRKGGRSFRTTPSAGATYPLEVYLVAGKVRGLAAGLYHYDPLSHTLSLVKEGDLRDALDSASLRQGMPLDAPASIVIGAVYERTTMRYGRRGIRYVHMEVGHVGQSIHLQAESLELGTVVIGAFHDEDVTKALGLEGVDPLYIMPVGRR